VKKLLFFISFLLVSCTQERYVQVAEKTISTVVHITLTTSDNKRIAAAGVIISPHGAVLTCGHAFSQGVERDSITVEMYDGDLYEGIFISSCSKRDLGLIHILTPTKNYAKIIFPGRLKIGQEVIAIGHPYHHEWSVTHGIISALNEDTYQYNMIQTDAAVGHGSSGGGLFNLRGDLVGITTRSFYPFNIPLNVGINFAVAPEQILEFLVDVSKERTK
jgi:serine protease Do